MQPTLNQIFGRGNAIRFPALLHGARANVNSQLKRTNQVRAEVLGTHGTNLQERSWDTNQRNWCGLLPAAPALGSVKDGVGVLFPLEFSAVENEAAATAGEVRAVRRIGMTW